MSDTLTPTEYNMQLVDMSMQPFSLDEDPYE